MFKVLFGNKDFAVIIKPVGVISEDGEGSVCQLIRESLSVSDVYPIHRLDRDVGGVMVYALSKKCAAELSRAVQENKLEKIYLAVAHGAPENESGIFTDLLFKDSKKNKSFVVTRERKGVRRAELSYETLEIKDNLSLVRIKLHTGRSHQIRVQFSHRKMPLVGDRKYGAPETDKKIALFSHTLTFPYKGETLTFSENPSGETWDKFEI